MHPIDRYACAEYNAISRRGFLSVGAGAAVLASIPAWLPRVSLARDHRSAQRDIIISIYLRGAADGLSIVPPHAEQVYHDLRPTVALPRPGSGLPNSAIDLDGFFGLAPAMAPLLPAYNESRLLFVHACGSKNPSRSHFEAQQFMEVGKPGDTSITTGWLGRHLASIDPVRAGALLRAVGMGFGLPQTLVGGPGALPVSDLDNYGLLGNPSSAASRRATIEAMYASAGTPLDHVASTALATIDLLDAIDFAGYAPAGGAAYPSTPFGMSLRSSAALMKANIGVEAISIDVTGWDTHNSQGTASGVLAGLMNDLARGLAALDADMTSGNAPSFTVVAMSEFGRRVMENGSGGTDHGHGAVMMVLGPCVNGGQVMTQWPGLAREQLYQERDLEVTIDFRDILAEIVQSRLGNPNLPFVFPGFVPTPRGVFIPSC
ncbi:MAG: DUF1501 domain-containing protein [Phycisphaerae bacterium]|nr:DUF1501 domain-containing protein [Phycisphaerae bacterium]